MDADRFDTLAKTLTGTRSRRSALGAALASSVLGALGLGSAGNVRAADEGNICVPAGDGGLCVVDFLASVRQGPGAQQTLASGNAPGSLRGYLRFSRSTSGNLLDADLLLEDGSSLPVVGQVGGYSLQVRIDLGQGQALVAVGVAEQPLFQCLGRIDGTVTGTQTGDLGEWHAIAGVQNIPGGVGVGTQGDGSADRPASSSGSGPGTQLAKGNTPASGSSSGSNTSSGGNVTDGGNANRPVAATSGNQPGSNSNGAGSASSGGNGGGASGDQGSDRPASASSSDRPGNGSGEEGAVVEERQETGDPETTLACPESETRCNNVCVNLQTDASNCGKCGNACSDSQTCLDGACGAGDSSCAEGQERCSNACVNTTNDVFNCGTCGNVCALDEECNGGQCRKIASNDEACPAGQTRCSGTCTDLQTDEANCGACNTTCAAGETCAGGTCTPPAPTLCPEGQVRCDGVCKEALPNFGSEGISCPGGGAAPTECPVGRVLCNGACFPEGKCQPADCPPGWGYCYGVCRDLQNDPGSCGTCGTACAGGVCQNGRCFLCPEGHMPCGGACVNVQTDLNNCGFCGVLCGTQCINGQCTGVGPTPGCAPGAISCDGACIDPTRDFNNCGGCGKKCTSNNWECAPPGVCRLREEYCEQEGKVSCGTYCSDLEDHYDCGDCGYVCPADEYCEKGLCYIIGSDGTNGKKPFPPKDRELPPKDPQTLVPTDEVTCAPGLEVCAGACTDLSMDPANCGGCGNTCNAGDTCQQGQCSASSSSTGEQTLAPTTDEPPAEPQPDSVAPETVPASSSSCLEGQVDCGGVCTDLSSDPLNCGACGVTCAPDSSCDFGVCSGPAPVAPSDENVAAPAEEPVEPVAPPETGGGEAESAPVLEPPAEPEPEPVLEQAVEPDPAPAPELPADAAPVADADPALEPQS